LQTLRVITSGEPVVQRFKANTCLLQLLLGPFMSISVNLS